jgi:hypothetical protein
VICTVTGGVQQFLETHGIKGMESTMGSSVGEVEMEMEAGGEMVVDDDGPVVETEAVAEAENAPATE